MMERGIAYNMIGEELHWDKIICSNLKLYLSSIINKKMKGLHKLSDVSKCEIIVSLNSNQE
jgi:hypothetical protein